MKFKHRSALTQGDPPVAFDYQLLAAARMEDYDRIAVKTDMLRRAKRSSPSSAATTGPDSASRSSIPRTPTASSSAS